MPSLDLSTKKSFIIYQQGIIENANRQQRYGLRKQSRLNRNESKSKMFTIDSRSGVSIPQSDDKPQGGSEKLDATKEMDYFKVN